MTKKKTGLLAVAAVSMALGVGAIGANAGGAFTVPAKAADHDSSHTLVEKAFQAPKVGEEGYRPYWRCQECCSADASAARFDYESKERVSLSDVVIPALEGAGAEDIASGDGIANVDTQKFKYVDQGVNGVSASSSGADSTPVYVKDSGKAAIYFSASGKTGEATNPTGNDGCAEFRFTVPTEAKSSKSVTFSYRYKNWGTGGWAGGTSASEPAGWTALCQFKDSAYLGMDVSSKLLNDDAWHTVTLSYADSAATAEISSNLTDFILKFADLRGYIMISGLSYEYAKDITLKNVNADGTDSSASVLIGNLPDSPTMDGKTFLGWYDESGNKVAAVEDSTTTLVARWTVTHYNENNDAVLDLANLSASDFSELEGVDKPYAFRSGADRTDDLNNNRYDSSTYGFRPAGSGNEYSAGIVFPAVDFSNIGGARFNFGFMSGVWANPTDNSVYLSGNSVGLKLDAAPNSTNFQVTIEGQNVSVYNVKENKTYTFALDEATYKGEKGLSIKAGPYCYGALLLVSQKIVSYQCDYIKVAGLIEASLPDTPASGYTDQIKEFQTLRAFFSTYESTANPLSSKMEAWIDAYSAKKVLEFTDNGASVISSVTGNGADQVVCGDAPTPYEGEENSLKMYMQGLDWKYVTLTLPSFDYSAYGSVSFTMGVGGGNGGNTPWFFYGSITEPDGGYDTKTWDGRMLDLNDEIGQAPSGGTSYNWDGEFTKVTISKGVIHFNSSIISDVTRTLDEDVNNGTKGLTLSLGICSWNGFVITPFYATKF